MTALHTKGFHHITMVSANAGRTLAFYRELLGVGLVKRTVNFDDPASYHLYFGDATGAPGTILTFFEWGAEPRGHFGVGGVHHLALGVASADAQLKWKRRLTDAGVPVSGPFDRGWFRSIYFSDPDGQVLEIATRGPGYAVDEPIEALGKREVSPPVNAEIRGHRDEVAIQARTHPEPVLVISGDMVLEGIHHISAISGDLEALAEFYPKALGLSLIKKTFNHVVRYLGIAGHGSYVLHVDLLSGSRRPSARDRDRWPRIHHRRAATIVRFGASSARLVGDRARADCPRPRAAGGVT